MTEEVLSPTENIAELDWFNFETRMRRIVTELLAPTVQRVSDNREATTRLQSKMRNVENSVEELDQVVHKRTKVTYIDDLNARMDKLESDRQLGETRLRQEIANVSQKTDECRYDISKLYQETAGLESRYEVLKKDLESFSQGLSDYQASVSSHFRTFMETIDNFNTSNATVLARAETAANKASAKSESVLNKIPAINSGIEKLTKQFKEISAEVNNLARLKATSQEVGERTAELNASIQELSGRINSLKMTELELTRYLDKYLPMNIQARISKNMFACLDKRQLRRLVKHEKEYLDLCHEFSVESTEISVSKLVETTVAAIVESEERDEEFLINIKSTAEQPKSPRGLHRKSSSSALSPEVTSLIQSVEPDDHTARDRRGTVLSTGSMGPQPKAEVDSDPDSEEMSSFAKEFKQIKGTVDELLSHKYEANDKMLQQLNLLKEELRRVDNENKIYIQLVQGETEQIGAKRKRDKSAFKQTLDKVVNKVDRTEANVERLKSENQNVSEMVACLVEFSFISHSLMTQDEEDKQTLKLLGTKGAPPAQSSIKISADCLSCAGKSSIITHAFKLACISYDPSPLSYRSRVFSRVQLLQVAGNMLQNCWGLVSTRPPYDSFSSTNSFATPSRVASRHRKSTSKEVMYSGRKPLELADMTPRSGGHLPALRGTPLPD
jgi:archaellum component FlaC